MHSEEINKDIRFFLKKSYKENLTPEYYLDVPSNLEYQHCVYKLASYLGNRSEVKYIVDLGAGSGQKLKKYLSEFKIITVDFGKKSALLHQKFMVHIDFDLENGLSSIREDILENSIVIAAVIEHLVNPHKFLKDLSNWVKIVPFILISTPDRNRVRGLEDYGPPANKAHVREWSLQEFRELLAYYNFGNFLIGYTENTDFHKQKTTILAIAGEYINYTKKPMKKVLATIHSYNEGDMICETIEHLLNQGIDVCFVDNHSKDRTYEVVNSNFGNNNRVIIRMSENYGESYEWYKLLKTTENITHEFKDQYDWFMHHDSDELRYSPLKNVTLQEMISFVDSLGYNAIDFTVVDFRYTQENENVSQNYEENLLDFEFGRRPGHFKQVKCWKYAQDISLAESGGHEVLFKGRKIYPIKFLLKHYPLRNINQARKKIFEDRILRIIREKKERGWHVQYDRFIERESNLKFNRLNLIRWHPNIFDVEFLVERISGIGIEIE